MSPNAASDASANHARFPHKTDNSKWGLYGLASYAVLLGVGWWLLGHFSNRGGVECTNGGKPIVDVFPGAPWRTAQTGSSHLLLSDGRMRVESHEVVGEDGKRYADWIWMDVVDQVNVLPYVLAAPEEVTSTSMRRNRYVGGTFRVFRQKKYGLAYESLAVLGGQVEMARKEKPIDTAKRELEEEMSLIASDDSAWVPLGEYRVNVNRGHGNVSCFLVVGPSERVRAREEFHVDELERQATIALTVDELDAALRTHAFAEVKWAATAALALAEVRRIIEDEEKRLEALEAHSGERRILTSHARTPLSTSDDTPVGIAGPPFPPKVRPPRNEASMPTNSDASATRSPAELRRRLRRN